MMVFQVVTRWGCWAALMASEAVNMGQLLDACTGISSGHYGGIIIFLERWYNVFGMAFLGVYFCMCLTPAGFPPGPRCCCQVQYQVPFFRICSERERQHRTSAATPPRHRTHVQLPSAEPTSSTCLQHSRRHHATHTHTHNATTVQSVRMKAQEVVYSVYSVMAKLLLSKTDKYMSVCTSKLL